MNIIRRSGWIELICGCMFSGKSEELIRRVHLSRYGKLKVETFKPIVDDRYSEGEIISHNGVSIPAEPVETSRDILQRVSDNTDVVAIDELQFFDEGIVQVATTLADQGVCVIVAGLDQDFRGQPYGKIPELTALAETVTKLQAVCVVCSSPASRTQRLVHGQPASYEDPTLKVGASETYEARCRHCHKVSDNPEKGLSKTVGGTVSR